MKNQVRLLSFAAASILCLFRGNALAASYSLTPDTLYFTPTGGQTTMTGHARVQYVGDTTMPGTHIHASISSGSAYFSTGHDTIFTRSRYYWTITYTVQDSEVVGSVTFTDDTTSRTVVLVGRPAPDAELVAVGPYFLTTPKNGSGCAYMMLINRGSDVDTILSATWSHGPGPLFSYDTTALLPRTIQPHDTLSWTICFHAPNDTLVHLDTVTIRYADEYNRSRTVTRIVYAKAVDTTHPDGELTGAGPYWAGTLPSGSVSCQNLRLVNTGLDADTILSVSWSHEPLGIFTYDTSFTLPRILTTHDTAFWIFCFQAPSDTVLHADTLYIHYHDAYSQDRFIRRIVMARAADTNLHECYALAARAVPVTELGDTNSFRLYIANRLDSNVQLTGLHVSGTNATAFLVDSSSFPRGIAAHQYDSIWMSFAPNTSALSTFTGTLTATFTTNDTSHCRTAIMVLSAHSSLPARDTETVSLSDTAERLIALVNDSVALYYSHRVEIVNSIGMRIRIDTVYLTGSPHMYIAQNIRSTFPDTLANGAKHSVIVHFYSDSAHEIYHDTLVVLAENALLPFYIYLDGYSNSPTSAVATIHAGTGIKLYPNPATHLVTVEPQGFTIVEIQLIDLLGNTFADHAGSGACTFDLGTLAPGHYFVRVKGEDILGDPVVMTRSLDVAR